MSTTLSFLEGPLFRVAVLLFTLGLLRRAVLRIRRARIESAEGREAPAGTFRSPLHTAATIATWTGLVLIGIFLADHVVAWAGEGALPVLPHAVADVLTIVTMAALVLAFGLRVYHRAANPEVPAYRHLPLLWFCLLMGYFASHPEGSPIAWEAALALHVLSACGFLGTVPFLRTARSALDRTGGPARERKLEEVTA